MSLIPRFTVMPRSSARAAKKTFRLSAPHLLKMAREHVTATIRASNPSGSVQALLSPVFMQCTTGPQPRWLTASGQWKTARIRLPKARFLHGQNLGADFRVAIDAGTPVIGAVRVIRGDQ